MWTLWLKVNCFLVVALQHSGPYLHLLCVRQSDAAPFCENYAKLYFDAKQLENRLNIGGCKTFVAFFLKKCTFWAISDATLIFLRRSWH